MSKTVVRTVSTSVAHALDNISHYIEPIASPVGYADKPKLQATQSAGFYEAAKIQQEEAETLKSPLVELLKLKLPRDYLISPMYTPDDLLRQLPPLRFIVRMETFIITFLFSHVIWIRSLTIQSHLQRRFELPAAALNESIYWTGFRTDSWTSHQCQLNATREHGFACMCYRRLLTLVKIRDESWGTIQCK